jgi:hypothetical protein
MKHDEFRPQAAAQGNMPSSICHAGAAVFLPNPASWRVK